MIEDNNDWSKKSVDIDHKLSQVTILFQEDIRHGQAKEDRWTRKHKSNEWERIHNQLRLELFTPMNSWKGPQNLRELSSQRVTTGKFVDGEEFTVCDNWKNPEDSHRLLKSPWVGTTTFVICANEPGPRGR